MFCIYQDNIASNKLEDEMYLINTLNKLHSLEELDIDKTVNP